MPDFTTPTAMHTALDDVVAGEIDRQIAPRLWLTLERSRHCWRMTLASDKKIERITFDRVAAAVSAPSLDPWQRNAAGTVITAEWREGWPPVRMVGR